MQRSILSRLKNKTFCKIIQNELSLSTMEEEKGERQASAAECIHQAGKAITGCSAGVGNASERGNYPIFEIPRLAK